MRRFNMVYFSLPYPMSLTSLIKLYGCIILLCNCGYGRVHKGTHHCDFYNRAACLNDGKCGPQVEDCANLKGDGLNGNNETYDVEHNYMICYVSWYVNGDEPIVARKGCWLNNERCKNVSECVENRTTRNLAFCCCDGNMCNKHFQYRPSLKTADKDIADGKSGPNINNGDVVRRVGERELNKTILCSIVPIIGFFFLVVTFYFMWRRHRSHNGHHQLPTVDPNLVHSPDEAPFSFQLLEHKAKGRFGYVWKAKLHDQYVAVKIFPLTDKKSFSAEVDIYKQTNMSHENILQFIGAEVKEENSYTEYYLITEYHEKGSLYDFLKANTITWAQLCRIGESMTSGLAYLHDEIPSSYSHAFKPAIAHRDFKSKNVLIKSDITACIADFGLAMAFDPNKVVNETHTQVGTRRYMAPEVLEGAICFNMDSFLRIDMYACSLVLWELMTRCTCVEDVVDDYRLPFEAEVGLQPSLEEMQPLVAGQKCRPAIKPAWYQSPGMTSLVTTMEECWDQDAEARLSAGCVNDRIAQLSRTINSGDTAHFSTPPHFNHHSVNCLPLTPPSYVPNPSSNVIEPVVNHSNNTNTLSVVNKDLGSSC